MASLEVKSGALVLLQDLRQSSPFFKQGASLRITGKLHEYCLETGLAIVIDGNDTLKVSTEHLRDLAFQVGSIYQFIGELLIQPDNEVMDQALEKGLIVIDGSGPTYATATTFQESIIAAGTGLALVDSMVISQPGMSISW